MRRRTTHHWDRNLKTHVEIPLEEHPMFKKNGRGCLWVAFRYSEQMELARQTKNVLLALQAELFRLYYRTWNKREPIVINCSRLGFNRRTVAKALEALEKAGWILVQRKSGQSARVTVKRGFYFRGPDPSI